MSDYDGSPAAKARRAMGRPPEDDGPPAGVGLYVPRTEAEVAERRADWLRFHQSRGTLDAAGGLSPAGHAWLDACDRHAEHMSGRGPNWLGVLSDDGAREWARRMALDGITVAGQSYGPGDRNPAVDEAFKRVEAANRMRGGIA